MPSIHAIVTRGFGTFAGVADVPTRGFGTEADAPQVDIVPSGAMLAAWRSRWRKYYERVEKGRKKRRDAERDIAASLEELYAELTGEQRARLVPALQRADAVAADAGKRAPAAADINWRAVARTADAAERVYAAWARKRMDEEDDEVIALL